MLNRTVSALKWGFYHPLKAAQQGPLVFLNRLKGRSPLQDHLPWMPFDANSYLNRTLKPTDHVLEFGSGGSTLFFAKRVSRVVSIEHDSAWGALVQQKLTTLGYAHVEYRLVPPEPGEHPDATSDVAAYKGQNFCRYLQQCESFEANSFDVIIIDGRVRNQCAEAAFPALKPGGILVLDNADRKKYAPTIERFRNLPCTQFYGLNPYQFDPGATVVWRKSGG